MTDDADPVGEFGLHCRVEPIPDPDSRITLTGRRDRLGMRQVALAWKPGELALKSLNRGGARSGHGSRAHRPGPD